MGELFIFIGAGWVIYWAYGKFISAKSDATHPPVVFHIEQDDSTENPGWSEEEFSAPFFPRPIKATIKLVYTDSSGKKSERIVDAKECDTSAPDGYLIGFCHLRRSIRTFRLDRIVSAVDVETGELIASLNAFAAKKYEESPVAAVDRLFEDHSDALRVLFYVAKADGRFTQKEKDIYLEYCRKVHPDEQINTKLIDSALKWVDIPTRHSYKVICGKLAKADDLQKSAILEAAEAMIATQKTVSEEEEAAIEYMKKRFAAGK